MALIATTAIFAQAPQGFNYQATVRNSSGALIVNQNVNFKFNIMLNSQTSVPIFSETHFAPTDDLGQVNLVIGTGTATTGSFSTINWGTGNYYLGIELNTGSGYVAMGTTQLLSVPYALYANSSGNSQAATPDLASVLAVSNGANNLQIKNLANPTEAQDAVTKSFSEAQLQTQVAQLQAQIESLQDQITLIQNPIINVIPSPAQASICSGTNTAITLSNSNNSPNITYSWTASCISGSISGYYDQPQSPISMINQVLINTGTTSGLVRYVVTPYLGANSGQSVNVDVTVNVGPYNQITTLPFIFMNLCQNQLATPLGGNNSNNNQNTISYQWYSGSFPIPGEINSIFYPPTNLIGSNSYNCLIRYSPNECDYEYTYPILVNVNPLPSIANIAVNINSGDTINLTPINGGGINNSDIVPSGTTFAWTNTNPSIGITSGSGTDLTFSPFNNGTTPMVAQIIVIPSTGSCQGESFTITFTINSSIVTQMPNVTIGNQIWSSTNLDVTTYRDGTPIPEVTDPTQWGNLTTGAWCYYNNDSANGAIYGKLYNWYAVVGIHTVASLNDPSLRKQFAPTGWHMPTEAEWITLTSFLGGESEAGGKMKSTGTSLWQSPNIGATNSSGFTGLPGGIRGLTGVYFAMGSDGLFWSSSEYNTPNASRITLSATYGNASITVFDRKSGHSVRCIKD